MSERAGEILGRIQQYLALGGFFNPESMEHDKVQQLVMDARDEIHALSSDRAAMLKLIEQADPWVQSRMHRHHRKAETEKRPYYQANHARESDRCEGWLVGAAQFLPIEYMQEGGK